MKDNKNNLLPFIVQLLALTKLDAPAYFKLVLYFHNFLLVLFQTFFSSAVADADNNDDDNDDNDSNNNDTNNNNNNSNNNNNDTDKNQQHYE